MPSFKRFWHKSAYNQKDSDHRKSGLPSRKRRRAAAKALWKALGKKEA